MGKNQRGNRDFASDDRGAAMTDVERLDKLKSQYAFKIKVHTNPVEVSLSDFKFLIDLAEKSLMRQKEMELK